MNWAVFIVTVRERLSNRVRVGFLAFIACVELVNVIGSGALGLGWPSQFYVLILGGGILSGDVASGVLQLVFARPVKRAHYALAKFAALAALSIAVTLAVLATGVAALAAQGAPPGLGDVASNAATRVVTAVGLSAVLVAFSALLPRLGDVALWAGLSILCLNLEEWLDPKLWPTVMALERQLRAVLWPGITLASSNGAAAAVTYLSTVTLALAIACVVVSRREVSYAD